MLFVYFDFCLLTHLVSYPSQTTPLASSLSSLPSHCNVVPHQPSRNNLLYRWLASLGSRPIFFAILIYQISVDPTVLDDFTKQADFASAAPFGLGPREERLDFDRLLEQDGAFPPTQLIRV